MLSVQERVPEIVCQLRLQSDNPAALELARAVVLNFGFQQQDIIDSLSGGHAAIEVFGKEEKLLKLKKFFGRLKLQGLEAALRRLRPKDWLTRWKSQWKPAALTKKLDVVPVWYRRRYRPRRGRGHILMDTLLSFGTGLHETTQIMAQFIEDTAGKFRSFLDIGTGTGILAFVALKYGAADVTGIDIGALSVQAAHDNMKANRLYFHVEQADIKKYRPTQKFDFVAANLVTEDLITHAAGIVPLVKQGGYLAVSGISLENLSRFKKKISSLPLKCLKIAKGRQWSGLLFQKKMS